MNPERRGGGDRVRVTPLESYEQYMAEYGRTVEVSEKNRGRVDIRTRNTSWSIQLPTISGHARYEHSASLIDDLQTYATNNSVLSQAVHGQCPEHLQTLAFLVAQWSQIADLIDPPENGGGGAVFCVPEVSVLLADRRRERCQIDLVGTTGNGRVLIGEIGGSGGKWKQVIEQCESIKKALPNVRPIGVNWTYDFNPRSTHGKLRAETIIS